MSSSSDPLAVLQLRAAVDAVMVPRGFQAGQGGVVGEDAQIIWCCGYDRFSRRFPRPPPSGQQEPGRGACVDLVVDVDRDGRGWRLVDVRLEGQALGSALREVGAEAGAVEADALRGAGVEEGAGVLRHLLEDLLARGGPASAP